MQTLINFFKGIGTFIGSVFDFIIDTVEGLAYIVKLTVHFTLKIPDYFSWLPPEFLALVALVFSIAVIYKILGREG